MYERARVIDLPLSSDHLICKLTDGTASKNVMYSVYGDEGLVDKKLADCLH